MDDRLQLLYAFAGAVVVLCFIYWKTLPLRHIPAIGPDAPLFSYLGAYRYYHHAREMLQEGYNKYRVFKVPMVDQWIVIVSGARMNEELQRFPDTHMSFLEAAEDFLFMRYTIAPDANKLPIHINVIKGPLTRNLGVIYSDVVDEMKAAFPENIPASEEWTDVDVLNAMANIVARASNRVFVGLPLCRNKEYLQNVVDLTWNFSKGRAILSLVPGFLHGIVGPLLPWSRRAIRKASTYLKPMIVERQKESQQKGMAWVDKPNDFLMWLIEEANRAGKTADLIVQGVIMSNFAAIHTSSHSITQAVYHLAVSPEPMKLLRDEIEDAVSKHGWTRTAVQQMWKLDSFMHESQRINGISGVSVMRKALRDVTFSDGTRIPAGTLVAAAATATHLDGDYYEDPAVFRPFRYSDMRMDESQRLRQQFVSTSPEYIAFGHGKHACPGRFFAVNELKLMMAYLILNYDFKFEGRRDRPANTWVWHTPFPPEARVKFRRRQDKNVLLSL
ncbi:cytochrome P450 [Laetiporus sulphureus 93-53]|uniref:Cytochrome P450 n=1 Tax=Laetiporus sulphureus 93-53 TaxID=1314785 RepID=A0A165C5G2_9APHY|nr:cytochrome P450 [Laetiporus sulphureus 93-53]KZT02239.1 cytochrome P450 [Laetiporus sulphureus 93-53]